MAKELRQDITGLRAIAVISVTLYHLMHVFLPEYTYFKGGFLGVDMFFVISGYLMTMIIMQGLDSGRFSLYDFYRRRAKRICPALLVTVVVFVAISFFLIGTADLKRMSYEGFYALAFVSNIYFAQKVDYFANSALDQMFLHTWSLSVEWQFYLVYPIVLMLLKRYLDNSRIAKAILILTALSLAFAVYYTATSPRDSYYLLPSRSFELLFGALAYFYPLRSVRHQALTSTKERAQSQGYIFTRLLSKLSPQIVETLGLSIILVSMFLIDDSQGWPTFAAFFPIFGAYLCIAANNKKSLLNNFVCQKIGIWSYAIYLVHWPLLVLVSKLGFFVWCFELLVPIMLFALALHYGIERRRNYGYICLACYGLASMVVFSIAYTGATFRLQHNVTRYAQYGGHSVPFEGTVHHIGDLEREPDFILVGDSFARHYTLDLIDRGLHVITVFRDGCYSFKNHVNYRSEGYVDAKCALRYEATKEALKLHPSLPVVFAQDWPRYKNALIEREGLQTPTLQEMQAMAKATKAAKPNENSNTKLEAKVPDVKLKTSNKLLPEDKFTSAILEDIEDLKEDFPNNPLYVLGTPMQTVYDIGSTCMYLHALNNPLSRFMRAHFTCTKTKDLQSIPLNHTLYKHFKDREDIQYIDPNDAICIGINCEVLVGKAIPVYQDGLHYSWAGSVKVVSFILSQIGVEQGRVRLEFEDEVIEDAE